MTGQEPARRQQPARGLFVTEESEDGVSVRVLRGSPTSQEIAALTAVLTAAVVEEAAASDAVPTHGPSAWQRSTRILRTPLTAGPGRWRNFSG